MASSSSSGGVGVGGLLLVAFVVLKLTGYITWSWWWVVAPIWIPLVTVAALGVLFLLYISAAHGYKYLTLKLKEK